MPFEHVQFIIPDSASQIKIWRKTRGKEWCDNLIAFVQSPSKGKVLEWNFDRYYELTYLWNEEQQTAVEITRYWIGRGLLPFHVTDKGQDGTGHRGVVDGMARRMQDLHILNQRTEYPERARNVIKRSATVAPPAPPINRTREILEIRRRRNERSGGSFESLSREERGLPPAELAQQQHPAYPDGVTYDAAHRIEHGRTTIFTIAEQRRLGTLRNILEIIEVLMKAVRMNRPSLDHYQDLKYSEKDLIQLGLRKALPEVKKLILYLESFPEEEAKSQVPFDDSSLPQTSQPGADLLANNSTLGPSNN
jgi:hypothetical protein